MTSGGAGPSRGLLVDFGGVLTTDIWASFEAFCRSEDLPAGRIKELFRSDPGALSDLRELERGAIGDEEFERRFAGRLGVGPDGLIGRLFAGLDPEARMVEAVKAAGRSGVATAIVSNSWGTGIYERMPLQDVVDTVVISGEVGLHKPEPAIYELAAERLGLAAGSCVFVDDLRENCAGAEAVGMTAVLHRDPDETIDVLERELGVGLR